MSAYLHAAAMVKAGVYLLARLGPAFGDATVWRAVAVPLGALTMLLGGWRALRETDLKRLLAYGTVGQLGFLIVLFGAGTGATALAGVAMLLGHALFKATLFLVVGVVDRAAGRRDLRGLSGLGRSMPWTCAAAVLAGASMVGLPPLVGFVGKEAALEALLADPFVLAAVVAGSALTAAYTLRFLWGGVRGQAAQEAVEAEAAAGAHGGAGRAAGRARAGAGAAGGHVRDGHVRLHGLLPRPGARHPPGALERGGGAAAAVGGHTGRRRAAVPGARAGGAAGVGDAHHRLRRGVLERAAPHRPGGAPAHRHRPARLGARLRAPHARHPGRHRDARPCPTVLRSRWTRR
ncbi:proton-conducting transporter membrane subunit [Nonomuraea ferruginea]